MVTASEKSGSSEPKADDQDNDVEKNNQPSDGNSIRPGVLPDASSYGRTIKLEEDAQPNASTPGLVGTKLTHDQRLLRQSCLPEVHGTKLKLLVAWCVDCDFVKLFRF